MPIGIYERQKNKKYGMSGHRHTEKSRTKIREAKLGDKNPRWKDGRTKECVKIRSGFEFKTWRRLVNERCKNICYFCGSSEKLHAHHIKPFAKYPELRFEVKNGVSLCKSCHYKLHKII